MSGDIRVCALVVVHPERPELLMVRKVGTSAFMLPGGKPEPGETLRETICREIAEELGLDISGGELLELGTFTAHAANEAGLSVTGTVFVHPGVPQDLDVTTPAHQAELAEAAWFPHSPLPADSASRSFAPLTRLQVIPELRRRGLI